MGIDCNKCCRYDKAKRHSCTHARSHGLCAVMTSTSAEPGASAAWSAVVAFSAAAYGPRIRRCSLTSRKPASVSRCVYSPIERLANERGQSRQPNAWVKANAYDALFALGLHEHVERLQLAAQRARAVVAQHLQSKAGTKQHAS